VTALGSPRGPRRARRPVARYVLAALLIGTLAIAARLLLGGSEGTESPLSKRGGGLSAKDISEYDPFAYDQNKEDDFVERGRNGYSHVIFEKSPGGVEASAARVAALRDEVDKAARAHDVDADRLEALVFLESAGRPDVIAGDDPENAVGLAQILPGTAVDLLGMRVDLQRSQRLTRRIRRESRRALRARRRAQRRAAARRAVRLAAQRRRIDQRFDPGASLDGAARYLQIAKERFGRDDLAAASYHMGIGNLEQVIARYVAPRPAGATAKDTVDKYDLSYAQLFYDSTPLRNPRTWAKLVSFGDDSRSYLFRLEESQEIMRLWRDDRDALRTENELQLKKASREEVLRPADETDSYGNAEDLRDAYDGGQLVRLPANPRRFGFTVDPRMGVLAKKLGGRPALYRGLRPEALATLLFIAKEVRRIAPRATINVTSTVRDRAYQDLLVGVNAEATNGFSLHTTGFAIDIERSRGYNRALEPVLDRLRALNVISYVFEPQAIHLTVGPEGERFMELYDALLG
jgi:Transglycosylase SLT domain